MLTADLVRARVAKGEVRPRYVDPNDASLRELAASMIALYAEHVGRRRDDAATAH
jgi:predicted nuclease of restriction endonuclease-like RecB superfamily